MWSRRTGWADAKYCLESNGLEPIKLGAKEGNNNTNNTIKTQSCRRKQIRHIGVSPQKKDEQTPVHKINSRWLLKNVVVVNNQI